MPHDISAPGGLSAPEIDENQSPEDGPSPHSDAIPRQSVSRRGVLGGAAGAGGMLALSGLLGGQGAQAQERRRRALGTRTHIGAQPRANVVSTDPALHLARRLSWGMTPELVGEIRAKGGAVWIEEQLNPTSINDSAMNELLGRFSHLNKSGAQLQAELDGGSWDAMEELAIAAVARACWSKRQLFEIMVEFWSNHLNVTCPSSDVWDTKTIEDRTVIRAHALGKFSALLLASAKSPAMGSYLNNDSSKATSPNENYGRELLELHTVGVGTYTERDVKQSTLVLTGLTSSWPERTFRYRPEWHYVGPVSVMGWSHANGSASGGLAVAESYLSYLAHHPSTAAQVCSKLVTRFVSDTPQPSLVARLVEVYLANDTAIVPVLRALFESREFLTSAGLKAKRPLENLAASVRAMGIGPGAGTEGMRQLYWMSGDLGQSPMGWAPPNGYPDVAAAWTSSSIRLAAWNMHLGMIAGWWPNKLDHPGARSVVAATPPASVGGLVDALSIRLVGQTLPAEQRAALIGYTGQSEAETPKREFLEWQLPYLIALVLDSPVGAAR